jgi:hypothetical protein
MDIEPLTPRPSLSASLGQSLYAWAPKIGLPKTPAHPKDKLEVSLFNRMAAAHRIFNDTLKGLPEAPATWTRAQWNLYDFLYRSFVIARADYIKKADI